MSDRRSDWRAFVAVLIATAASFGYFAAVHRDVTLLNYAFKFPDSWDWLVAALAWLGCDVIDPVRAPFTPIAFATMFHYGVEDLIPFWGLTWHHLMVPAVYLLIRAGTGSTIAAVMAALLTLTSASMLGNALYVGSDVCANTSMVLTLLFFWLGLRKTSGYFWPMGFFWGISALTQYAAFILAVPVVGYLLVFERRRLRDGHLWAGCALAAVLGLSQFAMRFASYGDPLYSRVTHLALVRPHADQFVRYVLWSVGFFSWPVLLLAVVGCWDILCRRDLRRFGAYLIGVIVTLFVFFVFLYDWPDNRFILYWAPLTFGLAGIGFRHCCEDLVLHGRSPAPNATTSGRADSPDNAAAPSRAAGSATAPRLAVGVSLALAVFVLAGGSLARSHPFSDEIVPWHGVAIDVRSSADADASPLGMHWTMQRSHSRYDNFYAAHARRLRRHRDRGA
ncbi:MAG: glycosyltransferase family 39 protein, partial [Phycisphaerae bacterium]